MARAGAGRTGAGRGGRLLRGPLPSPGRRQRSTAQRRQPEAAAGGRPAGGGRRWGRRGRQGAGRGWRAGRSCDPDTRSPPGRGQGRGGGGGARPPAGPPPPHTPSRGSRGKGTHRPGGRARRAGVVRRSGRGWGCGALRREPDRKAENHFIARVWGRGESREGTHSRLRPGERLRGA